MDKKLRKQLFKLLQLHSPSGKEWGVAKYLLPILKSTMDNVWVDDHGNIYAEKRYGDSPYTVLLNSHMDTVASHPPVPKWRKGKSEIFNSDGRGALGGDDKCGIATHLAVIRHMNRGTRFTGTVKVLFTRQEEIGCVGASKAVELQPEWFDDIDCSIVVDRRGGDNIITGGWSENFCHENFTQFWVDMSGIVGIKGVPQEGTISDTMIFAERGINSVNLSGAYYNAHTKDEYIKIDELERIVDWVYTAFNHIQSYGKFPKFEYDNYTASYTWGGFMKKNETKIHNSTPTCGYCDHCGRLHDTWDLDYDDDGLYICNECFDTQNLIPFVDCECCMNSFAIDDTIEYRGHTLCVRCVADLEDVI